MPVRRKIRRPFMATLLIAAVAVYLLALGGAAIARHHQPDNGAKALPGNMAVQGRPPAFAAAPPLVGFAIELHHTDHFHLYLEAVDQLAAGGAESVLIVTPVWQENGAASAITIESRMGRGPTREQLERLLNRAHERGLKTALMPIVLMTHPRGNEWRGRIHPDDWPAWWASYRQMIAWFAQIAAETRTDLLYVGSELLTTEHQPHRWVTLIDSVRRVYPGTVGYTTNWDHYTRTQLWPLVDVVGINGYWDITGGTDARSPDPAVLAHNWVHIREDLLAFAEQTQRPVVLTELGYPSLPWGLKDPWNYVTDGTVEPQPQLQAMGYAAFLKGFGPMLEHPPQLNDGRPAFAGVFFYRWDVYSHGGPTDTGYGIRGKPAVDLIHAWLQKRSTPDTNAAQ